MAEAARFKPAQMTLLDRSVPVQINSGGAQFNGWMAYKRIVGLAAYTPEVVLPPGPGKQVKVGGRTFYYLPPPVSYSDMYLTSIDPLEADYAGTSSTSVMVNYKGKFRIAYRVLSGAQQLLTETLAGRPTLQVIEFTAELMMVLRRSPTETIDYCYLNLGAERSKLFPSSTFEGAISFYFTWPAATVGDTSLNLDPGWILIP